MDIDNYLFLDIIILVLGLAMVGYTSYLFHKFPKNKWYLTLPSFFFALHLSIFYGFITISNQIGLLSNENFVDWITIWSVVQRLHGVITVFITTYLISLECTKHGQ